MSNPEVHTLPVEPPISSLSREQLIELLEARHADGIQIDFAGKSNARQLARKVRPRVLRTIKKYSAGSADEQARNLVIEGDNLQAMATLYRERGQVDLVIADPPYNTGNDFRYNDKWEEDPNDSGLGDFVSRDDGARHTKWMRFMWPRLQMMKAMLKPAGVLAICIDHRELFRLGQMLDELFGQENRLGVINWQKSYSPRGDNRHLSTATEYVLIYAKDETRAHTGLLPRTDAMDARYTRRDGDARVWKSGDASGPKARTHQGMVFAIQSPFTGELYYPPNGSCWRDEQAQILQWLGAWNVEYELRRIDDAAERARVIGNTVTAETVPDVRAIMLKTPLKTAATNAAAVLETGPWPRIYFGIKGTGRPQRKNYLEDVKQGKVPITFWADEDFGDPLAIGAVSWTHDVSGHSQTGIDELDAIVGDTHGFETVKPSRLIQRIIQLWCPPDGLVFDPFAGSGTTGHAVLELNHSLSIDRRFILIEQGQPEDGDSYARSLTADRLARAISGERVKAPVAGTGGGFRFATLERKVDAEALLSMEREELADTIIASHFDANTRRRDSLVRVGPDEGYQHLAARNRDGEGFFLVWNGSDANTDFTEDVYEECALEAQRAGLTSRYHVYARLYLFQTSNVAFYQIPDRILMDFGLDLRGEPFNENDTA